MPAACTDSVNEKKATGLLLFLLITVISPALAEKRVRDERDNAFGWLQVEGAMMESACRLEMASRSQTVLLPATGTGELLKPGDTGTPATFYLRLQGCMRSAGKVINTRNNTLAWSARQPLVSLRFLGPADAHAPELFQVNGAKGIGLRLRDASGNVLRPGEYSAPIFLSAGDNSLRFTVVSERTAATLSADGYRAIIEFQLNYH